MHDRIQIFIDKLGFYGRIKEIKVLKSVINRLLISKWSDKNGPSGLIKENLCFIILDSIFSLYLVLKCFKVLKMQGLSI